ncbi:hypothetical protein AJ80_03573 [Polytolypa hystricis UAMH7299]|uniref:J domain-containing protein n=1 Tax=Polytolypa hystricis (strain UAMH7299) TaxID=1447883 RepID=A0A2B7YHP1_POLH7|nr:hypothetical protein AJ80_03573 [Polytolypa hystricis UAMH7299]
MVLPKLFSKSPKSPDKKKKHKHTLSSSHSLLDDREFPATPVPASTGTPDSSSQENKNINQNRPFPPPPLDRSETDPTSYHRSHHNSLPHHRPHLSTSKSSSSPRTSPRKSPVKQSSKSRRDSDYGLSGGRPPSPTTPTSTASSPTKHHRDHRKSSSKTSRFSYDRDSHPLNLPPDELRRLSAMAAAREDSSMDIDPPASPAAFPTAAAAAPSANSAPTNHTAAPETNGVHSPDSERSPTPPPHAVSPTPPAPVTPVVDAEACKLAGNKFFKSGDYKRAIEEYTKAVEAQPSSSTYLSNRAAAYISANRYLEALQDAKAADELEPDNPKIMHRLARIYTNLGRPAEALSVYAKIQPPASAKDKAPAEVMLHHVTQAETALRQDKGGSMTGYCLDQAMRGLGNGVTQPRKWKLMRVEAYLKMGNVNALGDAQNIAMSLLRDNSQDPDALYLRGQLFYAQGEPEQAIKHFRLALSLDPDSTQTVKYLRMVQKLLRAKDDGNAAFKAGKFQEAINLYTKGLEIDPANKDINSKLLQNRAQAYINLSKFDQAIADCSKALELDPSYVKAKRVRAKAYGGAGNWEEAVRELKSISESHPGEKGIAKEIHNAEWELKKSQRKDYYKILGVDKDASDHEIKKAYRRMAIQHHPDKNRDAEKDDTLFKEIGEAYEILSDPQKRAAYDNGDDLIDPSDMFGGRGGGASFSHMGGMGGMGGGMGGMGGMGGQNIRIDPNILFNMMNGGGGGGFSTAGGHPFGNAGW